MSTPFAARVSNAFGFLAESGFELVREDRSLVIFRSVRCVVSLFYDDHMSFEISMGISRLNPVDDPSFSFDEILRAQAVDKKSWPIGYCARSPEDVGVLLAHMGRILKHHGMPLLDGDEEAWRRLENQRRRECLSYAKETRLRQARSQAEAAWEKREYAKVVVALESVDPTWLSKTELAKLDYAGRSRIVRPESQP